MEVKRYGVRECIINSTVDNIKVERNASILNGFHSFKVGEGGWTATTLTATKQFLFASFLGFLYSIGVPQWTLPQSKSCTYLGIRGRNWADGPAPDYLNIPEKCV